MESHESVTPGLVAKQVVDQKPDPPQQSQLELVNVHELARILNVPVSWVYERTRLGTIPCVRLGKYIRFDPEEVLAFFREQAKHGSGDGNSVS